MTYNPLEVINRSRNVQITMFEGVPDEDGEWQFSVDALENFRYSIKEEMMKYGITLMTRYHLSSGETPLLYTNE